MHYDTAIPSKIWTFAEEETLKRKRVELSIGELAKLLGRTRNAVKKKLTRMAAGGSKRRAPMEAPELDKRPKFMAARNQVWSDKQVEFLRKNFDKMELSLIAESLGRSRKAVQTKATEIGLRRDPWKIRVQSNAKRAETMAKRRELAALMVTETPAPEVPEEWLVGMIEVTPGHAYDVKSFDLRMRAYGKRSLVSEIAC